jgi:serine/threonine protein kinase
LKKGYNKSVDFWALGILAYELLFGIPPFYDFDRDTSIIFKQILKKTIKFKAHLQ